MHDTRTASDQDLNEFADLVADQIRGEVIPLAMALDALHAAALELNRRHGNASLQGPSDLADAIDTLIGISDLMAQDTGDMDINWPQVHIHLARAMGCVLDKGTSDMWNALRYEGFTREGIETALQRFAITEGRARGFQHRPRIVARPFFPRDAVAPF